MSVKLSDQTVIGISSNVPVSGLKFTVFGISPNGDRLLTSGDVVDVGETGKVVATVWGHDQYYVVFRSGEEGCRFESKALSTGGSANVVLSVIASTPTG
jgi:hypothetical protein